MGGFHSFPMSLSPISSTHSYGSVEDEASPPPVPASIQADISDIKSYFKHRSSFRWGAITEELWDQKWLVISIALVELFLLLIGLIDSSWRAMGWKAWVSIEVTVATLTLLVSNKFPPAFIFLSAMSTCYALNIVTTAEALEGFSNSGVITVGVLVCVRRVGSVLLHN
jgi:hypothetical protein